LVTGTNNDSAGGVEHEIEFRRGIRTARQGNWFALLVSGVVVLAAIPSYHYLGSATGSTGCRVITSGAFICRTQFYSNGPFGIGLGSSAPGFFGNSSPSATTYWVISILLGTCAVVGFIWIRSRKLGTAGRFWPYVTIGLGALVLGVASRNSFSILPAEMTIRGMQALLIIALGLIALAIIGRGWTFSIFVAGFLSLALLSCLYDVSNLFQRLGVASHWTRNDQTLPNLILPGVYLLIGGVAICTVRIWRFRNRAIQGASY
jgi:hypothetical protein